MTEEAEHPIAARRVRALLMVVFLTIIGTSCADDGTQPTGPQQLPFQRITFDVGYLSTCALDLNDRAWCWGTNYRGQLGNGTTTDSPVPVLVAGDHRFVSISVNDWTHCALADTGVAWCWGDNQAGQLGAGFHRDPQDGATAFTTTPQRVRAPKPFIAITAAAFTTAALRPIVPRTVGAATVLAQSGGWKHPSRPIPCGVTVSGDGYCWGADYLRYGLLGNGAIGDRFLPTRVAGDVKWTTISPETNRACGTAINGDVYCWGGITGTQAAKSLINVQPTPIPQFVAAAGSASSIDRTCITLRSARAGCVVGVVDSTTNRFYTTIQTVPGNLDFVRVSGSSNHACGQTADGRLYCWGENSYGQVGDGTKVRRELPAPVFGNTVWKQP